MEKISPVICIDYMKSFSASGVEDVLAFNDREIRLAFSGGGRARILGEGLKIIEFEKRNGEFKLSGAVVGLKFSNGLGGAMKRFLK